MFPTTWYGATFFSRTYWPRPAVSTEIIYRDPYLTEFLVPDRDATSTTVDTLELIPVPASDFVLVD